MEIKVLHIQNYIFKLQTYFIFEGDVFDVFLLEAAVGRQQLNTGKATETQIVINNVTLGPSSCQFEAVAPKTETKRLGVSLANVCTVEHLQTGHTLGRTTVSYILGY